MKSKLLVVLMTLMFALSMVAQTAAPAPAPTTNDAKTCTCEKCADCCKDGKCMSKDGSCCGKGAKCNRKSGDKKMAMANCCGGNCADCCKDGKCADCCKDGKCARKGDKAASMKGDCCGGKCDRKAHEQKAGA